MCTPLSSHFIPNPVFVPRQARDKHGKIETMSGVFSQVRYTAVEPRGDGKKTVLFVRFHIKMIVFPRQARDKHRENSKKRSLTFAAF